MYVPAAFAADDAQVAELLGRGGAADLVTVTDQGPVATMVPFVHDPAVGPRGALLGHLARGNDQWRRPVLGPALVIVRAGDGYVSPTFYASTQLHGRVVPTWNYVTAHVYGEVVWHHEPDWLAAVVRRLTDLHEAGNDPRWSVDDAPPPFVAGQLRAIVGVELVIARVEAKLKLSQNRPVDDVAGVVEGLAARGADELARAVRAANPPS